MKIASILGARPQFIKAALLSNDFCTTKNVQEIIIHTGQHFDEKMSHGFFTELDIPVPDFQLNINQMNHGEMTGTMMTELEKILLDEKPNGVLVYGDTNSTLAGSLAAAKLKIPVFHVEAGLRSFNRSMPEEINRVVTDHLSSLLFCPTKHAIETLKKERITHGVIFSGDIMFDLFKKSQKGKDIFKKPQVLATIHRPSNTDDPSTLASIIEGLARIHKEKQVVLPVHPRTEKKLKEFGITPAVNVMPPLSYNEMVSQLLSSEIVITDSGGVQKEAFFAKTKCITVRPETEWVELIDAGVNHLCDSNADAIWDTFNLMNNKQCDFTPQLYGDGNSAKIIVDEIQKYLS
ncbi:MAG: UDP-N-acetylglucosamine 2-epimerase (non-hydrolyzing) [Candidatus Marinimicrobia bacterium]|nr:UDP-N-acetylglucosamine 2-epimerase (non-hydrolyzing) [Candidatus Neomarinimicrobiota bacterium]|tara:strand:- start:12396 stop:13439 length:1044 start_codon:yes stop_codon:yes gene_type:complete